MIQTEQQFELWAAVFAARVAARDIETADGAAKFADRALELLRERLDKWAPK